MRTASRSLVLLLLAAAVAALPIACEQGGRRTAQSADPGAMQAAPQEWSGGQHSRDSGFDYAEPLGAEGSRRLTTSARATPGSAAGQPAMAGAFRAMEDARPVEGGAPDGQRRPEMAMRPGEELWVIVPAGDAAARAPGEDAPGSGSLLADTGDDAGELVPVPLEHTGVRGSIDGYIASINVRQQFHNPYDAKIEAVYVFPLPQNAAVNGFVMTVGERTIRGVVREREEAERIYEEARSQGHVASLLTQERPNIFTQKVANIEPGQSIDIDITYFHTLAYKDGWFEYVFPMVVGPRFNPPATAQRGDGVGAVDRRVAGASGQRVEVAYLRPEERSGHDISLELELDAGLPVEAIESPTHDIAVTERTGGAIGVRLADADAIPNKDFVLRYRVAGDATRAGMIVQQVGDGGYFTMLLAPPLDAERLERAPVEFVFVLDCSGSMSGRPLEQAKAAVEAALDRMLPGDTFQIIRFSDQASTLGTAPLPATEANLRRARQHLRSLHAGGGTMMRRGIEAALGFRADRHRTRYVTLLTDGYIGNDNEILALVAGAIDDHRIFSFGVGSSPNRFLMERVAKVGRGAVAYVGLEDDAGAVMDLFFDRVSHPALAQVAIDWGDFPAADVYPERVPDLFVGRPIVLTGRIDGPIPAGAHATIRVNGRLGGASASVPIEAAPRAGGEHAALDAVWARMRIADLADHARTARRSNAIEREITRTALAHNLVSEFTAFLAVDSISRTTGEHGVTVDVPVPVPDGVRYDTTVSRPRR